MYPTPPAPTPPGTKDVKPVLQGVRNKQRKGVQKANAKFEPQTFRDQLIKHLESVPAGDWEAVATKLDVLGNQLDYRKYEQQLFEILLVGGLLAPGGGFLDENQPGGLVKSPFSVIGSAKEPVELNDVRKIVDVFNKLMRRYKYLQKPFEETALRDILQYTNKFSAVDQEKLAVSTSLFVSSGLVSASVLLIFRKDHLVKDGTSLTFLTTFLKTYLQSESLEHLSSVLRKGTVTNLEAFFPPSKQNAKELAEHFKKEGLAGVVDFYVKQRSTQAKDETLTRLIEMVSDESDLEDILSYLKSQFKTGLIAETEFIVIVWNGLVSSLDMNAKPEQINDLVVKEIASTAPVLEAFCQKPTVEVALINTIQVWAYENTKLMPAFPKILKTLYSKDVLSDQAIIYWYNKGSKPQARQHFLKAAEPLVNFLKEQEEEEEDEEEDEEQ